ncbi:DegV family protein [Jiangella rhizosphaerae]|uniref:DegV family protein n=1 Tax=Jiangella rhizosphaerae TaxID=2293569 RepID=A0A418KI15_9ACTN|nr:DegV family protein [Jiangella rhizosphaerae]RIQ12418.1 DegV family protein [Jiangella rhizosphaerae]
MTARVAVVTDSTAHLTAGDVESYGVRVVPLQVVVDGVAVDEWTPAGPSTAAPRAPASGRPGGGVQTLIGPREVADALRAHVPVTTSRPSPRAFLDVYESAAAEGYGAVVSVHISGSLSGTADAARLAARDAPIPVHVVDSRSLGMGLGFAVLAAASAAERGLTADEVAELARDRAVRSSAFFYVDTLEYLRRGGRVGAASAVVGTALAIKPLLHLRDGWVDLLEKVRTSARARARLEDLAVERALAADGRVDLAVHHLDNAARAGELAARLADRLPSAGSVVVTEVGAVIGAHVGPGLLAVVISPR